MLDTSTKKYFGPFLVFLNLILTFAAVIYLTNFFSDKMPPVLLYRNHRRFAELLKNLDEIKQSAETKTLFIGTSVYQHLLDPKVFDRALNNNSNASRSYNLAFEGNTGLGLYALINRLNMEFKIKNTRFKNVIIELSPIDLNRKFKERHKLMLDRGNPDAFLDFKSWSNLFLEKPILAIYYSFLQIFKPFDWDYLPFASSYFDAAPGIKNPPMAGITRAWMLKEFSEPLLWNSKTAGLSNWNLPQSTVYFDSLLTTFHEPDMWQKMLVDYQKENGVDESFGYDENLVNLYIDSIKMASEFAEHVYVVKLPYSPDFQSLVNQYIDQKYILKKVSNETKATLYDLTKTTTLSREDYIDAVYMRPKTMNLLLEALAKKILTSQSEPAAHEHY